MSLAEPSLIFILLLYLFLLTIGIWVAKKITSVGTEQLFLAGRTIGLTVGSISMAASFTAGKYSSEIAQTIYSGGFDATKGGLVWCQTPIAAAGSLCLGGLLFARPMRRKGYITVLDPCTEQFGAIMGTILFIPLAMNEFVRVGSALSYFGDILFRYSFANVGHGPVLLAVMGIALISVTYCSMGGVRSVIYTDAAKFALIFCELWIFAPCALSNYNLVRCIRTTTDQWVGKLPASDMGLFSDKYFALIVGGVIWQGYFQRFLSARTEKDAQLGSFLAALLCLLISVPSTLLGAAGRSTGIIRTANTSRSGKWFTESSLCLKMKILNSILCVVYTMPITMVAWPVDLKLMLKQLFHWNKTEINHAPDEKESVFIFTMLLQALTPPAIASIGIGVVAVATVAAFDNITATSVMFTTNVFRAVVKVQASEPETIRCFRTSIVVCGLTATALGCVVLPYYGFLSMLTDMMCVALFPQILCGLYFKVCNGYGSLAALLCAVVLRILSGEPSIGLPAIIRYPYYDVMQNNQLFPYRIVLTAFSFLVLWAVSLLAKHLFVTTRLIPPRFDFLRLFNSSSPDLLSALDDLPFNSPTFRIICNTKTSNASV